MAAECFDVSSRAIEGAANGIYVGEYCCRCTED